VGLLYIGLKTGQRLEDAFNFKAPDPTAKLRKSLETLSRLFLLPTPKPQTLASPPIPNPAIPFHPKPQTFADAGSGAASPLIPDPAIPFHPGPQILADAAAGAEAAEAAEAGAAGAEAAQGATPGERGAISILPGEVAGYDAGTGRALGEQLPHDRQGQPEPLCR